MIRKEHSIKFPVRFVAGVMLVLQIFVGLPLPLLAQISQDSPTPTPVPVSTPQGPVEFHSGQPDETIIHPQLQFPAQPSDADITTGRVFQDPLIPTTAQSGAAADPAENQALADALLAFKNRQVQDDWSALTNFMSAYPASRWNAALDLQLGLLYRQNGYFSKALASLEDGWTRSKNETETQAKMMADRIVGELLNLYAGCGLPERMQEIFDQIAGRKIFGAGAVKVTQAKESYWLMKNKPNSAFRCGPMAINSILNAARGKSSLNPLVSQEQVTGVGASLEQLQQLSAKVGLNYQAAQHTPGAAWPVPSVIHWKVGHFGAIIGQDKDRYLVRDSIMQGEVWMTSAALDSEGSGYALIPGGTLPDGWEAVSAEEAGAVWGTGDPTTGDEDEKTVFDSTAGGDGNGGSSCVAGFAIMKMLGTLQISLTPIKYVPAYGPPISFSLVYNYLETRQPSNFTFMNTGIFWTNNWTSYVVVDSSNNVTVTCRGGGTETYDFSSYDRVLGQYAPNRSSQAVLKRVVTSDPTNPVTYQRILPDGFMEVYSQPDSTGRIFLKQVQDPQGNAVTLTYDPHFRLTTITAADGAALAITYVNDTPSNVGFYKVKQVTEPFTPGRSAQFTYDSTTTVLTKVSLFKSDGTTSLGIDSQFTYGDNNFIQKMTTPYGDTNFYPYIPVEDGTARGLMAILPNGSRQVLERYVGSTMMTYYWDQQAMDTTPGDRNYAYQTHWMMDTIDGIETMEGVPKWTKAPLEGMVVYTYEGESTSTGVLYSTPDDIEGADTLSDTQFIVGKIDKPSGVSRKLDDDSTQTSQFTYNAIGHVTQSIDPLGRTFSYLYPVNNIDLYEIRQTKESDNDLLTKTTYNSKHQPLTVTDASGRTTTLTYNANAQLATVTNAKGETTTYAYGTSGSSKDRLVQITGALNGGNDITTFGYDSLSRLSTSTSVQGPTAGTDNYTVTGSYDDLDRVVSLTYPDGTTEQNIYTKGTVLQLDLQSQTDRLGQVTQYLYDNMGQVVQTCDPQGGMTTYAYLPSGLLATLTDPSGHATKWTYDEQGRCKSKIYADGTHWDTDYESLTSRMHTTTDARGTVTTDTYNIDDSLTSTSYAPGSGVDSTPTVSYTYDADYPRVLTVGDSSGTYTYNYNSYVSDFHGSPSNGRGNVSSIENSAVANSTAAFTYDELGRVTDQQFNGTSIGSVSFDAAGRVSAETNPLGTFTPTYHNAAYGVSRPDYVTCSNGMTQNFAWENNAGDFRLDEIHNKNASSATISKFDYVTDAAGRIKQWTKQTDSNTPVAYDISYNRANEVTAVTSSSSGVPQYSYSYDAAGNRTGKQADDNGTDTKVTQGVYNNLNQITSADGAGGPTRFQGSLDKPGTVNVNSQGAQMWDAGTKFAADVNLNTGTNSVTVAATSSGTGGATQTKTYTVVIPSGASRTLTYDMNGNMTDDGNGHTLTWDAADQLVKITYADSSFSKFSYDAIGQRVKIEEMDSTGSHAVTSTKIFVGNEQRDASNTVIRQYFDQGYRDVPGSANYYYTTDHQGSIREVVGSDGTTVAARYDYDPYGKFTKVSGSQDSDFLFTGYYYHAASGLYLSPTRAYDSNLGRFISRDPIAESGGLNLYAYCGNDPINGTDPMGLQELGKSYDGVNIPYNTSNVSIYLNYGYDLDFSGLARSVGTLFSGFGIGGGSFGISGGGHSSGGHSSGGDTNGNGGNSDLSFGVAAARPEAKPIKFNSTLRMKIFSPEGGDGGIHDMTADFASAATFLDSIGLLLGKAAEAGTSFFAAKTTPKIGKAVDAVEDFLGGQGKIIKNADGDTILMRGDKKVRFDIKDPHGDNPHFHLEQQTPGGRWKDAGPEHRYYFPE